MLVRLLYASRAVDANPDDVIDILAQSRQFNPRVVSPASLCYSGGIFYLDSKAGAWR